MNQPDKLFVGLPGFYSRYLGYSGLKGLIMNNQDSSRLIVNKRGYCFSGGSDGLLDVPGECAESEQGLLFVDGAELLQDSVHGAVFHYG